MNTIKQGISRGDIFYADLSPVVGCEQGGIRPVLILQNDIGNRHSPTTIVCAITGKPKKPLPTHAAIAGTGRLPESPLHFWSRYAPSTAAGFGNMSAGWMNRK